MKRQFQCIASAINFLLAWLFFYQIKFLIESDKGASGAKFFKVKVSDSKTIEIEKFELFSQSSNKNSKFGNSEIFCNSISSVELQTSNRNFQKLADLQILQIFAESNKTVADFFFCSYLHKSWT